VATIEHDLARSIAYSLNEKAPQAVSEPVPHHGPWNKGHRNASLLHSPAEIDVFVEWNLVAETFDRLEHVATNAESASQAKRQVIKDIQQTRVLKGLAASCHPPRVEAGVDTGGDEWMCLESFDHGVQVSGCYFIVGIEKAD
jgi:hypothetical protein